ncbi:hypothetical protein A0W34_13595 [Rhodococcus sp. BH4]|uniref:hypothetical protein n=1 Tax=Rhodococcus sp. BH4 TaxID=1807790 RepID=UPI0009C1D477|nr:hypothetical protein [Rhodococcus sp. BH4]ARE34223.1 hypothetical protein A0W34_13595 [Rhodococcus sp. BH4]
MSQLGEGTRGGATQDSNAPPGGGAAAFAGRDDVEDQLGCFAVQGNRGGQRQSRTVAPVRVGAELAPFTLEDLVEVRIEAGGDGGRYGV